MTPDEYLGSILKLCQERRGNQVDLSYVGNRAMVQYDLPLNEVVFDFYDRLKSVSKGYASFDYQLTDYRAGDLVKMQILVNAEPVDALSVLVHRSQAERTMAVQSVAMTAQTLWLTAHAAGLGACWLCAPLFVPELVVATLNLPADWEPQGLLTLGWPAEEKEKTRAPWPSRVAFLDR